MLLVTLDSCRFDTFESAAAPALKAVGPLHKAHAPANFTYASHKAMFAGFTPGVESASEPFINPKFAKIFKMVGPGFGGKGKEFVTLYGRNVIDGFKARGYQTIGSGAAGWFNLKTETGRELSRDFDRFFYPGNVWSLDRQLEWLARYLNDAVDRRLPVFAFLNVGETHVPYYHQGAGWDRGDLVCVPFATGNNASECRRRQRLCLEFVDGRIGPLLEAFAGASTVVCGDHGDAWGEDGLWEHGIHHEKVYEVPLLLRLNTRAVAAGGVV